MNDDQGMETGLEADTDNSENNTLATDDLSQPYIGQWNHLVSTTNWEKGRIIHEWRTALIDGDAPAAEYADEAWSKIVGRVSPQHVGRLRRSHERFGDVREQYAGLSWSHFQATLDWDDAEMWLEGASQSKWSVSQMRGQRWESLGAIAEDKPQDEDVVSSEFDEDASPTVDSETSEVRDPNAPFEESNESFNPDFGDETGDGDVEHQTSAASEISAGDATAEHPRPLADLPELPGDLTAAFDAFKLAILNHKVAEWSEVSRDDVLATLDGLKEFALAESSSAS